MRCIAQFLIEYFLEVERSGTAPSVGLSIGIPQVFPRHGELLSDIHVLCFDGEDRLHLVSYCFVRQKSAHERCEVEDSRAAEVSQRPAANIEIVEKNEIILEIKKRIKEKKFVKSELLNNEKQTYNISRTLKSEKANVKSLKI